MFTCHEIKYYIKYSDNLTGLSKSTKEKNETWEKAKLIWTSNCIGNRHTQMALTAICIAQLMCSFCTQNTLLYVCKFGYSNFARQKDGSNFGACLLVFQVPNLFRLLLYHSQYWSIIFDWICLVYISWWVQVFTLLCHIYTDAHIIQGVFFLYAAIWVIYNLYHLL